MTADIYQEIEERWRNSYANIGRDAPSRSEFSDLCREVEAENREKTVSELQPWLGILELGIEWLTYVHFALCSDGESFPTETEHKVPHMLIGSAVSFGLSIRTLCLSGFDTPARALLRTYVETLFLCLAGLHDKDLSNNYSKAQSDDEIKSFWHTTASPKNLHRRVIKLESNFGFSDDMITVLSDWRREEYEILSQSAHLSFVVAALTAYSFALGEDDSIKPACLGLATGSSIRTLSYAAKTTWYFSRLSFNVLLGRNKSDDRLLVLDRENDTHQKIVLLRDVLSEVIQNHWEK